LLSAPAAASVSSCRRRSCLPLPLPPLLSAGAIDNVAATTTAAPVPSRSALVEDGGSGHHDQVGWEVSGLF